MNTVGQCIVIRNEKSLLTGNGIVGVVVTYVAVIDGLTLVNSDGGQSYTGKYPRQERHRYRKSMKEDKQPL